jgi:hypothetical protein
MKLKSFAIIALGLISSTVAFSQEEKVDTLNVHEQRITTVEDGLFQLKKLKFSGYIQAQWQSSQLDSLMNKSNDMKVGTGAYGSEKTSNGNYNRYGVRRGRLKATYEDFGCQAVVEFDISESGLKTKDLYLNVLDPWLNTFAVKGGVFDNPFGYEIGYSSSKLESPERSRLIQTLFPDEKTLGSMLTIQAPKTSPWNVLKLEAGLVAGNAISKDYKSKKDFVGHLTYNVAASNMKYGVGVSLYSGTILQQDTNVYVMKNGAFSRNIGTAANGSADRTYYGVDGQFSIGSDLGLTQVRAEYIFGNQPGTSGSSASPNGFDPTTINGTTVLPAPTYVRKFQGGYVNFVQDIADTKHSIVVKYDWYDPNTAISGDKIGIAAKTGKADMAYSTLGLGYMYRMNNNVRLMAYYDMVTNESTKVKGYFSNVKDNVVTVRLQYKF